MSREEKKQMIFDAAHLAFYKEGFEGTKMQDIAKKAGVGKGTLYEYFPSKQALFEEMLLHYTSAYTKKLTAILQGEAPLQERIMQMARYQVGWMQDHCPIFKDMVSRQKASRNLSAAIMQQNFRAEDAVAAMLKEAAKKGEVRADLDVEVGTALLLGTCTLYFSRRIFMNKQVQEEEYEHVANLIIHGLEEK